jgi:hypothetical protein
MKTSDLPGIIYQARCKSCGALTTYTQFEASFYDFDTYFGEKTGTLYRLDIDCTNKKSGKITIEDALEPAIERESGRANLRLVPEELRCPKCNQTSIMRIQEFGSGKEKIIKAVELPWESEKDISIMLKLTDKWISFLINQPETGMGYQVIAVILKDGRRFNQVIHIDGFLTQIRGYNSMPFAEHEINEIIVTHAKWDWNKE